MTSAPALQFRFLRAATAIVIALAALCGPAAAQPPASAGPDPAAAIVAAHKKIDDEYARALMSPFTAVVVQYFQPGQTHQLGVGPDGPVFNPSEPMSEIVELTLDAGAFRASPVLGAKSGDIVRKSDAGLIADGPGTPLRPGTRIGGTEAIRLGRYLVELLAASTAANARVFDPEAPARRDFAGLKWFPPNPALRVPASFEPIERPGRIVIGTSRGLEKEYFRVGILRFAVDGAPLALTALALSATPKPGDELFVPFRDATTGVETYEVGRYLTLPFPAPGSPCVLDFNAATNPLCNYSPYYNCPIPPRENRLAVPIRAGEMKYPTVH